jgi:hypothetical protein
VLSLVLLCGFGVYVLFYKVIWKKYRAKRRNHE